MKKLIDKLKNLSKKTKIILLSAIAAVLVCAIVITVVIIINVNKNDPAGPGADSETETAVGGEVVDDGPPEPTFDVDMTQYKVIYNHKADDRFAEAVGDFVETMSKTIGHEVDVDVDSEFNTPQDKELLIGLSNRAEAQTALERTEGKFTFNISIIGDKICVAGPTLGVIKEALDFLQETYIAKSTGGGKFPLAENMSYTPQELPSITVIDENKACLFNIIYPRSATVGTPISASAMELAAFLQERTAEGQEVSASGDFPPAGGQYDLTQPSFVIGNTDYPRSVEIAQGLSYFGWHLEYFDNQMYMYSQDAASSAVLLAEVKELLLDGAYLDGTNPAVRIPVPEPKNGYYEDWCDEIPEYVPVAEDDEEVTMDTINEFEKNYYRIYLDGVSAQGCDSYVNLLTASGYTLYQSNSVTNDNKTSKFATYVGTKSVVHVYYLAYQKALRILVCDKNDFVPFQTAPVDFTDAEKVTQPSMTIMDMDYFKQSSQDNGMGLVFTLADGSYIVYDGGYAHDTEKLFKFLEDNNKRTDGKILIRAWVLTHPHEDHYGNYLEFAQLYGKAVTLQYAVYQFDYAGAHDPNASVGDGFEAGLANILAQVDAATLKFVGAKKITPLVGQTLYFGDFGLEILGTSELIYPNQIYGQNDHSLIARATLAGNRVLITADTASVTHNMKTLEKTFGTYLHSEFMTAPHHGLNGSDGLYAAVKPSYVIFFTNKVHYEERIANGGKGPAVNYQLYLNSQLPKDDPSKYILELFYAEGGETDGYRVLLFPFMGSDWYDSEFQDGSYAGGQVDKDHWNDVTG